MGFECYLLKVDGGVEVEIALDQEEPTSKLIKELARIIDANPYELRLQGASGLVTMENLSD